MRSIAVLAAHAARLNREAGAPALPALFFFTDPTRTPDPLAIAARLPRGAAVVFRHFGARNRVTVAEQLAALCRRRGLVLLIAADPALAHRVGADGVHWPEQLMPGTKRFLGLETAAAHSGRALARARAAGMDAAVLGPVFAAPSGGRVLGPLRAGRLAKAAALPVIGLGGVTRANTARLRGRGFAGVAAIGGLVKV